MSETEGILLLLVVTLAVIILGMKLTYSSKTYYAGTVTGKKKTLEYNNAEYYLSVERNAVNTITNKDVKVSASIYNDIKINDKFYILE